MTRAVLYAEVPSFYAAIERTEDPSLLGRPVIVGGDPRKRGRVQAASLEAQAAGVEPEMSMLEALQVCPSARAVRTNMRHYREVSRRLFAALRAVHARLEPFGLGAAYADFSSQPAQAEPRGLAMRAAVQAELGLPLRVGLGPGKFVARLAAEEGGDSGLLRVDPDRAASFLAALPVARLDGVGRKTAARLAELGAHQIGDVAKLGRDALQEAFGPHGLRIFSLATGEDTEPIRASSRPQSISRELTVQGESGDLGVLSESLGGLAAQLEEELGRQKLVTQRVALKLRFADSGPTTRSETLAGPTARAQDLVAVATRLLERTQAGARPVRGIGLQLSSLALATDSDRQLDLFD